MSTRKFLIGTVFVSSIALGLPACSTTSDDASDSFPTKPVSMVVPYDAGGNLDTIARGLTQCMEEDFGQRIIIDNQPGSAGTIGTGKVAAAEADGYTIGISPVGPVAITPNVVGNVNYTAEDFDYFGYVSSPPMLVVVSGDSEFNTLDDLIQASKEESLVTVTPGASSLQAMFVNGLNEKEGTQLTMVQTDSAIEIIRGVTNNDYQVGVTTASAEIIPRIESGEIKLLAHGGSPEYKFFTDTPTFEDEGYGDVIPMAMLPSALIAPTGVPAEAAEKISSALETCLTNEDVIQRIGEPIVSPAYVPGDEVKNDFVALHELTSSQS